MTRQVVCPSCETVQDVDEDRRGPEWFCKSEGCDFPLFWAPTPKATDLDDDRTAEQSMRRRPGAEGRATLASQSCEHCSEVNDAKAEICWRCDQPIKRPKVEVVEVVEEDIFDEPGPELLPEPERDWRPWVIALLVALVLVTVAVLLLV